MNQQLIDNIIQLMLKGTDRDLNAGTISSVVITGITVVFIGLVLLIVFVMLYGKIFEALNNKKSEKTKKELEKILPSNPVATVKKAVTLPVVEDGIDEEIVAVITAAIAAMSAKAGKKMTLKSVKYAKPSRPAWANAGIVENTRPF